MFFYLAIIILNICRLSASKELLDLGWGFDNRTIFWPGQTPLYFTKEETVYLKGFSYSFKEFCVAEHGGTHFDAPYHFHQSGWKVGDVPLSRLFAKGAFLNMEEEHLKMGRDTRLKVKDLENWETRNGKFSENSVLLVKFGRSKFWQNRTLYLDLEGETMHFPGLSKEAAQWIANSKKIIGVGVDTPSIDPGNSTDYIAHRILAENSLYNLENVKLLTDLPETGFDLVVAPMKIEEGTGAAVRIFAIVNN
ncbi:kynurenine formamidase-like isoform X2 [Anthonomus grandis grandis]|uniref:kynurenine formamidase-like isoform X2 n=1 Tax=Anthonomus grandis grandis TaxID=2921223 RepID=UPI002164F2F0|nr:kynurenine formamidase-like isoform X2 [Anthonomus grandis grandis]